MYGYGFDPGMRGLWLLSLPPGVWHAFCHSQPDWAKLSFLWLVGSWRHTGSPPSPHFIRASELTVSDHFSWLLMRISNRFLCLFFMLWNGQVINIYETSSHWWLLNCGNSAFDVKFAMILAFNWNTWRYFRVGHTLRPHIPSKISKIKRICNWIVETTEIVQKFHIVNISVNLSTLYFFLFVPRP